MMCLDNGRCYGKGVSTLKLSNPAVSYKRTDSSFVKMSEGCFGFFFSVALKVYLLSCK